MADMAGMQAGLQLSGKEVLGNPIIVSASFAEKNRLHKMGASAADIKVPRRLAGGGVDRVG